MVDRKDACPLICLPIICCSDLVAEYDLQTFARSTITTEYVVAEDSSFGNVSNNVMDRVQLVLKQKT